MSDPQAAVIRPRLAVQGARPEQVFAAPAQEAAEVAVVAALAAAPCGLDVNSGLAASSSSETPRILRRMANRLISATA